MNTFQTNFYSACIAILSCFFLSLPARAQQNIVVNLGIIDGLPITPDNIFNYQVQSSATTKVQVKGTIRYRNSNLSLSYSFNYTLQQGMNTFRADDVHPQWQFSSSALQELFFNYKILPEGTYEYCVNVIPASAPKENANNPFEECLYHRAEDIFLINLIHPENDAKLKEHNPLLAWVANYSFSNALTYRVRVAEIKQGQNPVNAVMRNQPVYDENNVMQNSVVYPIYAKPLESNKYYAWTVDAFYKGILLGGAETWKFIIPEDTLPPVLTPNRSYIDIKKENGTSQLMIMDELKLKYVLEKFKSDALSLELLNTNKQSVPFKPEKLTAAYGDNRYILNLRDSANLKHMTNYNLIIKSTTGESYSLPFKYLRSDLTH